MTLSFTEIEYYALSKKKRNHMISKIIDRIKTNHRRDRSVYTRNNRNSQAFVENSQIHQRTKHIDICYY